MANLNSLRHKKTKEQIIPIEKKIERSLLFYPLIFQSRFDVLHHLFFVLGNGSDIASEGFSTHTFTERQWAKTLNFIKQAIKEEDVNFFRSTDSHEQMLSRIYSIWNGDPRGDQFSVENSRRETMLLYKEAFEQIEERKQLKRMVVGVGKKNPVHERLYPFATGEKKSREELAQGYAFFNIPINARPEMIDAAIEIGVYYATYTRFDLEKQLIQEELKRLRKLRKDCV